MANEIYELIDYQELFNKQVLNVYHYRYNGNTYVDTVNPNPATTIATQYRDRTLPDVLPVQGTSLLHKRITCRNLFDDTDSADISVSLNGSANTGEADDSTTFTAFGIRLNTRGLVVKDGAKRLGGVMDSAIYDGVISDPTTIARMNNCIIRLRAGIRVGTDVPTSQVWALTVVKRVREGTAPDYTYRLPETTAESVWADVASVIFNWLVTSQVSRKILGY